MKRSYLTTSIVYTNAPPHIGFALELIQADASARHRRLSGEDVFFLTGTDEHGLKIAKKAEEEKKSAKEFCDEMVERYKALIKSLNISNDDFIRTTDQKKHWPGVFELWKNLQRKGDIYEKEYEGLYCIGCEAFIVPRDLVEGKCPYHHKEPESVKEKNYFFRLSKYSEEIEKKIAGNEIEIIPPSRKKEILSFLKKGLEDVSFSRPAEKVAWGIPVPGDDSQRIYVWADALTNYISAAGYGSDAGRFKGLWPADVHFIGKDIFKFHALIWPGMLLSLGLELPRKIFVHGFLTVDGRKMSKSLGNVVDPFELTEKYGSDAVRYYFLSEISPTEDGDFSHEKFRERYNSDLAAGLGNLTARVIALSSGVKEKESGKEVVVEIEKTEKKCKGFLEEFKFNSSLFEIWRLIKFADRYIEKNKPWEESRSNREEVISDLMLILRSIARMVKPFMPETSEKMLEQIESRKNKPLFKRV